MIMINIIKIILKCLTPSEVSMNKLLLIPLMVIPFDLYVEDPLNAYSILVKDMY